MTPGYEGSVDDVPACLFRRPRGVDAYLIFRLTRTYFVRLSDLWNWMLMLLLMQFEMS